MTLNASQSLKAGINRLLGKFGYRLTKKPGWVVESADAANFSLNAAFQRLAEHPIPMDVATIIDIGASDGHWSRTVQSYYPNAHYFLIEANPVFKEALTHFKHDAPNIDFLISAAGNSIGEIAF